MTRVYGLSVADIYFCVIYFDPETKKAKKSKNLQMENNSFMTYCTQKRFTSSWTDVTKTFEENATMSFSLNTGLKLALPSNNQKSKANHDRAKDGSVSSSVGFHEPRGRR